MLAVSILPLCATDSFGATITQRWISNDVSSATVTVASGETIKLPKKSGGEITVGLKGGVLGIVTLKDFKDKKGKITYDTDLTGIQTAMGAIDEGFGTFELTTENIEGLYSNVTVNARLVDSTGFTATIGLPGDQIAQGGSLAFGTRWFSDEPIGIDPTTGEEIILGDFFLDSIEPLTQFDYSVVNPDVPLMSTTFTIGQVYRFSTGFEMSGTVTKVLTTVPEPSSLVSIGILAFFFMGGVKTHSQRRRVLRI